MRIVIKFKGISPLVATVLLIAFTVAVAGIIATWLTGFTTTTTEIVGKRSETEVTCAYGSINLRSLKYSNTYLSGAIENNGLITVGNISLIILYQNATSEKIGLCLSGGTHIRCSVGDMSLLVAEQKSFNVSTGSNYDEIKAITNCSNVVDTAKRSDVS